MAVIDANTKRTLKVLDVVKGKTTISKPEDYAEALYQLTRIIRLFNIEDRLNAGWGRYIYDQTMAQFGDDAEEKLMAKRKSVLKALNALDQETLNEISPALRRDIIEQRILDYEPTIRGEYKQLLMNLLGTKDLRFIKLSTHSPKPVSLLYSEGNSTLLTLDNFYIDPMTVRMFDNKKDASEFIIRLAVALIYCKRKNLFTGNDITGDKKAADYTKKLYKLFMKAIRHENESNMDVGDMLRDYELHGAAGKLMANDHFYITMKNLAPAIFIEFEPSKLYVSSFMSEGQFNFDEPGKEKVVEFVSKEKQGGNLYLSAVASLFDFLVKNFSGDDVYLERNFMPSSMGSNPWVSKLPMKIIAEATADHEDAPLSAFVGLKKLAIIFSDNDFIELVKPETDFAFEAINHTFIYSKTTMTSPESGMMHGTYYAMPEFDVLLNELVNSGKVDREAVKRANLLFSRVGEGKAFTYYSKGGKAGIIGGFTDKVIAKPKGGERK